MKNKFYLLLLLLSFSILFSCKNTGNAEKFYLAAVNSYAKQDLESASFYCEKALSQDRSFYQADFLQAKVFFMKKNYEESYSITKKLIKKYPQYTDARIWNIRSLILLDKLEDAEKLLITELSFNNSDWRTYYLYSVLYAKQNKIDLQLAMLNRSELALTDSMKVYHELFTIWDVLEVKDKAASYKMKSAILENNISKEE
ncbi:MAG: hypothetical protein KBT21_09760 [Treponema sp.]|nr:hypothetical protein [Candidatus Treponema merdequi]